MVPKPYTAVCPASLFNISRLVSCKNRQINRTRPAGDKKRERPARTRTLLSLLPVRRRSFRKQADGPERSSNRLRRIVDAPCRAQGAQPAVAFRTGETHRRKTGTKEPAYRVLFRFANPESVRCGPGQEDRPETTSAAFPSFPSHKRAGDGPHGTQRDPRHEAPVARGVYSSLPIAATIFCTVAMKRSASAAPTTRPTSSPFSSRIRKVG